MQIPYFKGILLSSLIANFVLAVIAGFLILTNSTAPVPSSESQPPAGSPAFADANPDPPSYGDTGDEKPNIPLPIENVDPQRTLPNIQQYLAHFEDRDLRIVPERFLGELDIPLLDENGKIGPALADILALGPDEIDRLNAIFESTAERLKQHELSILEMTRLDNGEIMLRIPPFEAETTQNLREELFRSLRNELGDLDVHFVWDVLSKDKNMNYWNDFGAAGMELMLTFEATDSDEISLSAQKSPIIGHPGIDVPIPPATLSIPRATPTETVWHLEAYLRRQAYLLNSLPINIRNPPHFNDPAP